MAWDKDTPLDSADASAGPADLRSMKTDLQTALQVEHTFPGAVPATPVANHAFPYDAQSSRPAAGNEDRWFYNTDN